mgnify:CR=1 FL=1
MGPSSPGRGLDCRGAPGHGGAPAGPPQRRGGVSPRPACLGERDLFVESILQVLSNILRPTVGAGDVRAGDVGSQAREGWLEDSRSRPIRKLLDYLAVVGVRARNRWRLTSRALQTVTVSIEPAIPPAPARCASVLNRLK